MWLRESIANDARRDPLITVKNLVGAGFIATFQGNYERARTIWAQARPLAIITQESRWLGIADFAQGLGEQDEGRPKEAQQSFESALATFRHGDPDELWEGLAMANLGVVTARLGDLETGHRILTQALELNRAGNHAWNTTLTLRYLGQVAKDVGDLDEAEDCFKAALQIDVLGILRWHVANSLEGLAEVSWLRRRPAKAARLYAVAARIRTEIGAPLEPALAAQQQVIVSSVRTALGEAAFAEYWQVGSGLTISEVVEEQVDDRLAPSPVSERLAKESGLTHRELDILRHFAAGKSMQEVSAAASISPRTVSTHLSNIYAKFNVNDRGAAVARAYQLGIVSRSGEVAASEQPLSS
jgi:DNA-binding CsgD family transcriptional regulator